jgi:hypothetical protein
MRNLILLSTTMLRKQQTMGHTASKPISDSADWSKPSIQAIPSLQPVVLVKLVKTKLPDVLFPVARIVILTTMQAVIDQNTVQCVRWVHVSSRRKSMLTSELIPSIQYAVPEDIEGDCKGRHGQEDTVRLPWGDDIGSIRPDNGSG